MTHPANSGAPRSGQATSVRPVRAVDSAGVVESIGDAPHADVLGLRAGFLGSARGRPKFFGIGTQPAAAAKDAPGTSARSPRIVERGLGVVRGLVPIGDPLGDIAGHVEQAASRGAVGQILEHHHGAAAYVAADAAARAMSLRESARLVRETISWSLVVERLVQP